MIPEGAVTVVTDFDKIYIAGGTIQKNFYELDQTEEKLIVKSQLPHCTHDRSAFGHCLMRNHTQWVIASGCGDRETNKEALN